MNEEQELELPEKVKINTLFSDKTALVVENDRYRIRIYNGFVTVESKASHETIFIHSYGHVSYTPNHESELQYLYLHNNKTTKKVQLQVEGYS